MGSGLVDIKDFHKKYPHTGLRFFIALAALLAIIAGGLSLFVVYFYSGPMHMIYIGIAYIVLGLLLFFTKIAFFPIILFALVLFDRFFLLSYQSIDESLIYSLVISAVFLLGMIACIVYKLLYRKFEKANKLGEHEQMKTVLSQIPGYGDAQNIRVKKQIPPSLPLPAIQKEQDETPPADFSGKGFVFTNSAKIIQLDEEVPLEEIASTKEVISEPPHSKIEKKAIPESTKFQIIHQNSEYYNEDLSEEKQQSASKKLAVEESSDSQVSKAVSSNILVDSDYQSELFDQISQMLQSEKPISTKKAPLPSNDFLPSIPSVEVDLHIEAKQEALTPSQPAKEMPSAAYVEEKPDTVLRIYEDESVPQGTFGEEKINKYLGIGSEASPLKTEEQKPSTELWDSSDNQQGSAADSIG